MSSPVDEVPKVVEQLGIVLCPKVTPTERAVLGLRPDIQQVEPVHICRYVGVLNIVPKHTDTTTLRELLILIVEVLWV